jgi:hypothetical protein
MLYIDSTDSGPSFLSKCNCLGRDISWSEGSEFRFFDRLWFNSWSPRLNNSEAGYVTSASSVHEAKSPSLLSRIHSTHRICTLCQMLWRSPFSGLPPNTNHCLHVFTTRNPVNAGQSLGSDFLVACHSLPYISLRDRKSESACLSNPITDVSLTFPISRRLLT